VSAPPHPSGTPWQPLAGRAGGLTTAARRSVGVLLLGGLPAALLCAFLIGSAGHHPAYDFRAVWDAGRDVLHGRSPYPSAQHLETLRGTAIDEFVYPAAVAVAAVPLAVLPFSAAAVGWTVALVAACGLALWLVGVRDWRCYGALLASPATLDAVRLGTLTPVLVLLVAAAWRWRDMAWRCGIAVAGAVVAKVFLVPLIAWLVVTRRLRAAAIAGAATLGLLAAGWAAVGLAGLRDYPHLLATLTDVEAARTYSPSAMITAVTGMQPGLALTAGALVLGVLGVVGLHRAAGDAAALAGAVGTALVATPILWLHYLMLGGLLVAIRRPAFGAVWLVGWVMWLSPTPESGGAPWRIACALAVIAACVAAAARPTPASSA
jgi:alpha-1,2-mannosyltransferase